MVRGIATLCEFFYVVLGQAIRTGLTRIQPNTQLKLSLRHMADFEGWNGAQKSQGKAGNHGGMALSVSMWQARDNYVTVSDRLHFVGIKSHDNFVKLRTKSQVTNDQYKYFTLSDISIINECINGDQLLYCPAVFGHFLDPPGNHPRGAIFPTVD